MNAFNRYVFAFLLVVSNPILLVSWQGLLATVHYVGWGGMAPKTQQSVGYSRCLGARAEE
jgi:hypothetical protein